MSGWRGYGPEYGVWVPDSEVFAYVARHIEDLPKKDRAKLNQMYADGMTAAEWVEWYFSGCFVHICNMQKGNEI